MLYLKLQLLFVKIVEIMEGYMSHWILGGAFFENHMCVLHSLVL